MAKKILFWFLFTAGLSGVAQEKKEAKSAWKKTGAFSVLLNQSAFSNWVSGGENNMALNFGLNYNLNYRKDLWSWDNKIIASYGLSKVKGQTAKKTDDRLEFNSLLGKQTSKYWFYSLNFNFKTQFDSGVDSDSQKRTSHFFSPAYFRLGPGMLWKKSDNLKINIAPLSSRLIFVHDHFTVQREAFGVKKGKTSRFEFGASIELYYKTTIMKNVSLENRLSLYSNYVEDPQNVDLDYSLNIFMKVNKYLSANLVFQTLYDDNAFKGFQLREVFGIGVNYVF